MYRWFYVITQKHLYVQNNGEPLVQPPVNSISQLINRANNVLPSISKTRIERIWGGLIDLTPDALPIIDHVPGISNLIVAAGFSGHGFGIAPATSHILSSLLLNKPSELPIEAFSIRRFEKQKSSKKNEELTLHG